MQFLLLGFLVSFYVQSATLKNIRGTVTVNSLKVDKERKVEAGAIISAIGKKSSVQIFFEDGSRSLLRNGQLIISEEIKKEKTLVSLVKGIFFTHKEKGASKFEIKTRNATMGIRGTKFYVEESPDDSYLCVCEGIVEIKNQAYTTQVEKNEDIHTKQNLALKKSEANSMMMDMAWDGFQEMGFSRK